MSSTEGDMGKESLLTAKQGIKTKQYILKDIVASGEAAGPK